METTQDLLLAEQRLKQRTKKEIMKITTVVMSDSDHNQTIEKWIDTLTAFMPVISAVDDHVSVSKGSSNQRFALVWEIRTLASDGLANLQVLQKSYETFLALNPDTGGLRSKSGYIIKAAFGPLLFGKYLYFNLNKQETVESATKHINDYVDSFI